jgi:3-oxoacyl-[acyl-carrier protein] reductase
MDLKDKVALVTGASRGIGRALALAFAAESARVAVAARTLPELQQVVSEIEKRGSKGLAIQADLSSEEQIKEMVRTTVGHFGRLEVLVNNAGFGKFHNVADFPTEDWDSMFAVNMRGLFLATREALPHLRQRGESAVINIASLAGKNFFKTGAGYSATKWGVLGFSKCLMLEEREHGVRVLAVCPGSVDTHFFDGLAMTPNPDKILKPEDVADMIIAALRLPQRAMVSEFEIRPTNP